MAKWLLDAGHGGADPGACYNGRKEAVDVLKLTKRVGEILSQNSESIDYTRTTDATVSLSARTNKENQGSYNYFVSIHRNAAGAEVAKGVETFVYSKGGTSEKLANLVNPELVKVGFVDRKVKVANFHVLRETKCSSILIEVGFIDHTTDNNLFDSKFEEIAKAIAKGCLAQVGKTISTPTPTPPPTSSGFPIGDYGKAVKTNDVLNVRSGRGTEHSVLGQLAKGVTVTVNYILPDNRDGKGDDSLWGSIDFNGKTGFIHLGYVTPVTASIAVGSKVKITGSHYATGQAVSAWAKSQVHTVGEISGDRARLSEINSWVYLKDLALA